MLRRKSKKTIAGILAMGMMISSMMFTTGCGSSADQQVSKGKIIVICKSNAEFWNNVRMGAEDAGKELGYEIVYRAPQTEDVKEQANELKEFCYNSNDVKGIVLAPITTGEGLDDLMSNSKVPIITIDSDVDGESIRQAYIGSNNEFAGEIAGRKIKAAFPTGNIQVGIVGHSETSQTAQQRIEGFKKGISDIVSDMTGDVILGETTGTPIGTTGTPEQHDRFEIVGTKYCGGDAARAKEQAMELLTKYPDIKILYATNEKSTEGVAAAIDELGFKTQVKVVGFNASQAEQTYISSGVLTGTIVQNPYTMGYLGVRYSAKLAEDSDTYIPDIDTGVLYITANNINDENVDLIVNPKSTSGSGDSTEQASNG